MLAASAEQVWLLRRALTGAGLRRRMQAGLGFKVDAGQAGRLSNHSAAAKF